MPNFDTKCYTVHRFIVAAYYGMPKNSLLLCSGRFEAELRAPMDSVDKKGTTYILVKQSQFRVPLYFCLPFLLKFFNNKQCKAVCQRCQGKTYSGRLVWYSEQWHHTIDHVTLKALLVPSHRWTHAWISDNYIINQFKHILYTQCSSQQQVSKHFLILDTWHFTVIYIPSAGSFVYSPHDDLWWLNQLFYQQGISLYLLVLL